MRHHRENHVPPAGNSNPATHTKTIQFGWVQNERTGQSGRGAPATARQPVCECTHTISPAGGRRHLQPVAAHKKTGSGWKYTDQWPTLARLPSLIT